MRIKATTTLERCSMTGLERPGKIETAVKEEIKKALLKSVEDAITHITIVRNEDPLTPVIRQEYFAEIDIF